MARVTDLEDLLAAVKAVLVSDLNGKIAAIEAQKIADGNGLTPTLDPVDTAAGYFLQSWSEGILNISPAVFYGCENVKDVSDGGGVVAKIYTIAVYIILTDNGLTNDYSARVFRYSRAIEETLKGLDVDGGGYVKIESVLPVSWPSDRDTSEEIKLGGVTLTISLA